MVAINLLPWRETLRRERRRSFHAMLVFAGVLGLATVLSGMAIQARRMASQEARNQWLRSESARLDARLQEIQRLDATLAELDARRSAVEGLQHGRWQAVRLLDALVSHVPDGVALKSLRQTDVVALSGWAQSNAGVSVLLRQLERMSGAAGSPELLETRAVTLGQGRDARRVVEFSIVLRQAPPAGRGS